VRGKDVTRALGVAMRIDSGSVHVNGSTVQKPTELEASLAELQAAVQRGDSSRHPAQVTRIG
jgi:hypothetical protein